MPTPLASMVTSNRAAHGADTNRGRASSAVRYLLTRTGVIDRPIDLARTLKRYGLTLSEAHAALNTLVGDVAAGVTLNGSREAIVADLARFGVSARAA